MVTWDKNLLAVTSKAHASSSAYRWSGLPRNGDSPEDKSVYLNIFFITVLHLITEN